jgi:hypothetical protein
VSGTFEQPDDAQLNLDTQGNSLEDALGQAGVGLPAQAAPPPVYRAMPDSRIPVSSKRGGIWRSRKDTAQKSMKDLVDAWDEAIRYYNHDQADHREGTTGGSGGGGQRAGNRNVARRLNERFSSTENIVFANVNAQIPELYAKNPIVSVTNELVGSTAVDEAGDAFARVLQKLIDKLFSMKFAPGINIKPKAKKAVVIALLTNCAWFEVGYTNKDKSSEQAIADLQQLSDELAAAKDDKEIRRIEGALTALDEKVEFLQPSGPFLRLRMPHQVLKDPNSSDPWLNDANWVLIEDMLPTEYINALYGQPNPDKPNTDEIQSVFEPTHVLNGGSGAGEDENFTLFNHNDNSYSAYGFDTKEQFDKACMTKVWYAWDKVTRRLEMYADNDWKWPIWVWDDPYQLQGFYPQTPLWFHENPVASYAKGEVSYYLDQQDQINEINDEKRRALLWARRNIFYNPETGITQEMADRILKGPDGTATPLKLPEGVKGTDAIFSIPPPSTAFHQLFDKTDLYQSVDRIASTNEVERGGQFKTNTTNKAIDYYSTMGNMRMDMRLDAIEDALGNVGWQIAQLCMRFMEPDTVQQLTGLDASAFWQPLNNLTDFAKMSVTVIGGSTQKLTTQQKKQEAVQVGQVMAQYVKAAPASALKVSLDMLSKAFDDFMISKEDWDSIEQEVAMMAQSQQGGAPGQQAGPGQPMQAPPGAPPGGAPPGPNAPATASGGMQVAATVVQALQQLPPPVLAAIGQALAQGVPPQQIFQQMLASQTGQPGAQPQGAAA